ncbi:hypothetical protein [Paenibacillus sp.]|uniref:hypothetical protein n=1 Tax=Paenibacillus sp. TaxID=58172 RepID=UPI002D3B7E46|nr:hypothetical protein [Paenibacillus sp.]HZG87855.1 hypothetical protein [Paenibacillus sp.]
MNITLSQQAYEQWTAFCRSSESLAAAQRELQRNAEGGELFFTTMQGKAVVFLDHCYWTFARSDDGRQITLLACLAQLRFVG